MGLSCDFPWFKDKLLDLVLRPSPLGLQLALPESFPALHACFRLQDFLWIFQPSLPSHDALSDGTLLGSLSSRSWLGLLLFLLERPVQLWFVGYIDGSSVCSALSTPTSLLLFSGSSHVRFFWKPMDGSPPGSSLHRISWARILEWVTFSVSRGSFWPRDWTHVPCIGRQTLYHWATWEALLLPLTVAHYPVVDCSELIVHLKQKIRESFSSPSLT